MKMTIFAIFDSKAEAYLQPFFSINVATGIRSFSQAANDAATAFYKHPGDYTLFELGTFDQSKGSFENLPTQINHGLAIQYKEATHNLQLVEEK